MLEGVLLIAGVLLGAGADGPERNGLAVQVRRLVLKLDSPELAERQAAEDDLLKLGPQVLDLLPQGAEPGKAEVAQRIGRVRQKLQRQRASLGAQPSRVTLSGKMSLADILTSLQRQTGNKICTARLGNSAPVLRRTLDIDVLKVPFWNALDLVLFRAGLGVYPYGEQGSVELVTQAAPRAAEDGYVSYAGPFRFQLVSLLAQRDLKPPESRSLKVELEVAWEPRVSPIGLRQPMADVQATDDRGNPMAVDTPEASLEVTVPRGPIASRLILPLALPPRDVRAIAELRGTLSALLPSRVEPFRFPDLGRVRQTTKRIAGVSVTLEGVAALGKSLEARLLVHFDQPGDALASHRTWIFSNPAYLETRDGKTIGPESVHPTRQTANELGLALTFPMDRSPEEYTLVYATPTTIGSVPLEYRFRDIPLP